MYRKVETEKRVDLIHDRITNAILGFDMQTWRDSSIHLHVQGPPQYLGRLFKIENAREDI